MQCPKSSLEASQHRDPESKPISGADSEVLAAGINQVQPVDSAREISAFETAWQALETDFNQSFISQADKLQVVANVLDKAESLYQTLQQISHQQIEKLLRFQLKWHLYRFSVLLKRESDLETLKSCFQKLVQLQRLLVEQHHLLLPNKQVATIYKCTKQFLSHSDQHVDAVALKEVDHFLHVVGQKTFAEGDVITAYRGQLVTPENLTNQRHHRIFPQQSVFIRNCRGLGDHGEKWLVAASPIVDGSAVGHFCQDAIFHKESVQAAWVNFKQQLTADAATDFLGCYESEMSCPQSNATIQHDPTKQQVFIVATRDIQNGDKVQVSFGVDDWRFIVKKQLILGGKITEANRLNVQQPAEPVNLKDFVHFHSSNAKEFVNELTLFMELLTHTAAELHPASYFKGISIRPCFPVAENFSTKLLRICRQPQTLTMLETYDADIAQSQNQRPMLSFIFSYVLFLELQIDFSATIQRVFESGLIAWEFPAAELAQEISFAARTLLPGDLTTWLAQFFVCFNLATTTITNRLHFSFTSGDKTAAKNFVTWIKEHADYVTLTIKYQKKNKRSKKRIIKKVTAAVCDFQRFYHEIQHMAQQTAKDFSQFTAGLQGYHFIEQQVQAATSSETKDRGQVVSSNAPLRARDLPPAPATQATAAKGRIRRRPRTPITKGPSSGT